MSNPKMSEGTFIDVAAHVKVVAEKRDLTNSEDPDQACASAQSGQDLCCPTTQY